MGKFVISEQELVNLVKKIIKEDSDRSELFNDYSETIDAIERAFEQGEYKGMKDLFNDEVATLIEQIYDDEELTDEEADHLLFMAEDLYLLIED
jgi:nicotinamide mononucleotide adenylyltransferase